MPLASLAGLSPPSSFLVLYHELLEFLVKLLMGEVTGLLALRDLGVAAVCFLKIRFVLLRSDCSTLTSAETFHQSGRSCGFSGLRPRSESDFSDLWEDDSTSRLNSDSSGEESGFG
jgi:hypothetical protein